MLYYTSILGTRPASAAASASAAAAGRRGLRREHYDASHVCQVMSDCSFRHVPSVLISLLHSGGPRSDFGRQLLGAGPEWRASSSDRRIHASIHLSLLMYVYIYIHIYSSIHLFSLYTYTPTHLHIYTSAEQVASRGQYDSGTDSGEACPASRPHRWQIAEC